MGRTSSTGIGAEIFGLADFIPPRVGKGLIWTHLHGEQPLYARRLTGDEVRARIDNYWCPYHDGKSCSPEFLELVVEYLHTENIHVAINDPYKGAELTRRNADPAVQRHSLQIEINRRLYIDEMAIEKSSNFTTLHTLMTGLAQAVCGFATGRP